MTHIYQPRETTLCPVGAGLFSGTGGSVEIKFQEVPEVTSVRASGCGFGIAYESANA
jgi:hypothetical protein